MSCHHIPSVRCPECADNRPSMGYWPTPCGTCAALREDNARLRQYIDGKLVAEQVKLLEELRAEAARERDEEREQKHIREVERDHFRAEVKRCYETLEEQREVNDKAWAEVARLEGLILDWWDGSEQPQVDGFVATVLLLEAEARRIRAQRGECRHAGRQQGETPCPDCSAQEGR